MSTHAPYCAVTPEPGLQPSRCSCGASLPFRVFSYRIQHDAFGWEERSRETLVAEVAARALARCYGSLGQLGASTRLVKTSVLIRRALLDDFEAVELEEIGFDWRTTWTADPETLERHGILDVVAALDGGPLSPKLRAQLAEPPCEAEIKEVLAPWAEYWRRMPR